MLQMIDTLITRATTNKAFDVNIPLLNISGKEIVGVASLFTSALFEFFVMVEPFENRRLKSLHIKG